METELFKGLAASADVATIFIMFALYKLDRRILTLEVEKKGAN